MSASGIAAEGVRIVYPNGHVALDGVEFRLPPAGVTALIGANGSGKSTLMKAIMGFVPLAAGRIAVLGHPAGARRRPPPIAYVPQSEAVDWTFPVLAGDVAMMGRYGHMGALRRPRAADRAAVAEALDRVGMAALAGRQIGELSGGQRKRVFIARALAQDSPILLLDEPFAGVDRATEEAIMALLRQSGDAGRLVLVATHHVAAVPLFCDRALWLADGRIRAAGPAAEIVAAAAGRAGTVP